MTVRHLGPGEGWPENVPVGWEGPTLDHNWCWLIEDESGPIGGLMACPMHGAIFLLRVVVANAAPAGTLRTLLHGVLREARSNGCVGFLTLTDPHSRIGRKLAHLAQRAGGIQLPDSLNIVSGPLANI